jgi:hypothetical protein
MSASEQRGKKRVETRNRRPPDIVRPQATASLPDAPPARKRALDRKGGGNLYVGGARNEHGTRVARRVVCARCGTEDHVPYAPKDAAKAMCRACAALVLRAYEVGTRAPVDTRAETCNLCGSPFRIPLSVVDDGDPLCPNCLRGFMTWSGSIDTPFVERQGRVIETRGVGVVVRKKATRDGG